ncbi:hypothetical protein TNCV_5051551 [Trichonephila clavipes]|nr:hypothetical protein TNCV_5051551 [Trichonephila clavipes]
MHAQVEPPHGKDKGIDNRCRTEKGDTKLNDKEKSKTKMCRRQVIAHANSAVQEIFFVDLNPGITTEPLDKRLILVKPIETHCHPIDGEWKFLERDFRKYCPCHLTMAQNYEVRRQ